MRMKATEASRRFSDLLSRVARGETVEVDRHGEVVAVVSPARYTLMSGGALLELIKRLPAPDQEFGRDVAALTRSLTSPADAWRS